MRISKIKAFICLFIALNSCTNLDVISSTSFNIASTKNKEWVISKATIEVLNNHKVLNTYPLSLDCEIDDIWDFHKDGKFFKYENLTKCKGEQNEIKVKGSWDYKDELKELTFSNWRFLNNKEQENIKFKMENLTDSTLTISANEVFPNTQKLTLVFKTF